MVVSLSKSELVFCMHLASLRYHANIIGKVRENMKGNRHPFEINLDGVISEYAFCKYFNIFLNCDTEPRSGGFDALLNGTRFDIKSTRHHNGRLYLHQKINRIVDYYALAIISEDLLNVDFKGYIAYLDAKSEQYATVSNGEILYIIEPKYLTKFKEDRE